MQEAQGMHSLGFLFDMEIVVPQRFQQKLD